MNCTCSGIAALREAVLKNKSHFDYDTEVEGMRALDRYTLRFRFEKPQPRFIQTMATADLYCAVAREVVEAYGDDIIRASGGHRTVPAGRMAALVEDHLVKQPDL